MLFDGKQLKDVTEGDLRRLITNGIREQHDLEYKQEMYGRSDDAIREMLKDASSMANANGGHILIGVREDTQDDGIPLEICGVENAGDESLRLLQSCLSSIQERILGLDAYPVALENRRHVIVVRVPRSLRTPHQVTFRGLYQCWKRHGRQKLVMTIDEIRDLCLKTEQLQMKLEVFQEERRRETLSAINGQPWYVMAATPVAFREGLFDIYDEALRKLLRNPPGQDERGWSLHTGVGADFHPSYYGLVQEIPGYKEIEVFRNGRVEFRTPIDNDLFKVRMRLVKDPRNPSVTVEREIIEPLPVIEYAVSFLRFAKSIAPLSAEGEGGLWLIEIALYNIKGFGLFERYRHTLSPPRDPKMCLPREHLFVPPYTISWAEAPDHLARYALDRIWNAFGYEKAPYFNAEGMLAIPNR